MSCGCPNSRPSMPPPTRRVPFGPERVADDPKAVVAHRHDTLDEALGCELCQQESKRIREGV